MDTDFDLMMAIAAEGYSLLFNDDNQFELFTNEGSTGHSFDSIQKAHRWVFSQKHIGNN